ncbi:PAS domain S-box-containing protein [Arcticibacter tournemirensis]|uniref:histidine kinase n=2 Tax=Arcticibacter tournemirensis TaxID=699437 RepID=A0A5M9H7E0_9SPHI|nr:PAS domain-containing protein [Arcticibacter tournemirensis]TQM49497.1 PAS domain S-box-containing protein [Arcticibacter tournemirensis]
MDQKMTKDKNTGLAANNTVNGIRQDNNNLMHSLTALLNSIPDQLLRITDSGECFLYAANNAGEDDMEKDCFEQLELREIFGTSVAERCLHCAKNVIRSGKAETYEYSSEGEDGNPQYFEARFVKNSERDALAIIRDITESARQRVQNSADKELYENVINSVNVSIAVLDDKNRYILVNNAALKDDDVRKWIIGKDDSDYSRMKGKHPEIAEARMKMYSLADELREPVEWIEEIPDGKSNKRFFARTLRPFNSGNKHYKIAYGVDITALKVVQDELLRREHLLSFSHKLARIGYWVYYPRLGKHEWSDGVYDILGLERNYIPPSLETYYGFIHPDDSESVKQNKKLSAESASSVSAEFRIVTKGGEVKYIKEQSSSRHSDTEEYVFGVIQDITEIKQHIDEKERLIKEINHKYNDLMQFNYIISHNLRSPVANILGMSSLFEMDLSDEERSQIYEYILESAESIDSVIKDLNHILSFKSDLNEMKERFRLSEIVKMVCSNLKKQIKESDAAIFVDIAEDADIIFSIRSYIQSIIYNLISNSIKYKAAERFPEIIITSRKESNTILIKVADNGIGIDMNQHKNELFGLYKRFTDQKEGRGLGLHMTKVQVDSLGGTISAESIPGRGTTFTVSFGL